MKTLDAAPGRGKTGRENWDENWGKLGGETGGKLGKTEGKTGGKLGTGKLGGKLGGGKLGTDGTYPNFLKPGKHRGPEKQNAFQSGLPP
jgi:hypothetical protein